MREKHITNLLDNSPLANLSSREVQTIRAHIETCALCHRAFEAAQISALLIKEKAEDANEKSLDVNPFFQTRVLAAWRERQAVNSRTFGWLWKSAGALVSSMAATTAVLAVLALVTAPDTASNQQTAALIPSSAETVMLDQNQADDDMSDDQVLSTIYADEDEGK